MDHLGRELEDMSREELISLAIENGITDETDREQLLGCLRAINATQIVHDESTPDQTSSPPFFSASPIWEPGAGRVDVQANLAAAVSAVTDANSGTMFPPSSVTTLITSSEQDSIASLASPRISPLHSPSIAGDIIQGDYSAATAGAARGASASDAGGTASGVAGDILEDPPKDDTVERRHELIDTFVSVTQASGSKARQFLDATDWSIDAALNLFMESGGDSVGTGGSGDGGRSGAQGATTSTGSGNGDIRRTYEGSVSSRVRDIAQESRESRIQGGRSRHNRRMRHEQDVERSDDDTMDDGDDQPTSSSINDLLDIASLTRSMGYASLSSRSQPPATAAGGDAGIHDSRYPNGYSDDGVRAPIPARRDILIGGSDPDDVTGGGMAGAMHRAMSSRSTAAEEKDTTDWIFNPPEGLSFPSSFLDTKTICKEQKKWLMVNIQDHEEFASHRLNKDVWSNETIQTLLRGNFIFWQRNKTLGQARYYMEKYNLDGEILPHTAIIDPRTGAPLVKVVGFVEPEDLSMVLVEFLENNNLDQMKAPKLKTIGLGNVVHESYKDTPGRYSIGDDRNSPGNIGSGVPTGDGTFNISESFGSEEYEYEDDDDDIGQGSSVDGNDGDSTSRTSTGTSMPTPIISGAISTPTSSLSSNPVKREPRKLPGGAAARAAAIAATVAVGAAELLGPWGHGTPEDEARAVVAGKFVESLEESTLGEEANAAEMSEVPDEPEAGAGVTQVRFRLPNGVTPATIARRFWLKDRVSVLFQYVRNTVEDAPTRSFDLLSGHPPSSLFTSKALTVEEANLSNSAILMRWT